MYAVPWVCGEVSTTMKYWLEIQPSAECCWKPICSFSLRKCVGESACRRPIGTECTLVESLHHQSYRRQLNIKPFCGWYDFGPHKKACLRSTLQKALFVIKGDIKSLYFCKIWRVREDWISMHAGFGAFLTPPPPLHAKWRHCYYISLCTMHAFGQPPLPPMLRAY